MRSIKKLIKTGSELLIKRKNNDFIRQITIRFSCKAFFFLIRKTKKEDEKRSQENENVNCLTR